MNKNILLVEDSPTDAAILIAAFEEVGYAGELKVAINGLEAIVLLEQLTNSPHPDWPQLILLDLNLPIKGGLEVLETIKSNPDWMNIPTVILSSSSSPKDVEDSYQRHANAYIAKPRELQHYEAIANSLCNFWFEVAQPSSF